MIQSVHSLRQAGNKVRVNHKRRYFDPVNKRWCFLTEYERILSSLPAHVKPSCHGGETHVEVTNPRGVTLYGVARCSKKDAFSRKEGVKYALAVVFAAAVKNVSATPRERAGFLEISDDGIRCKSEKKLS